MHNSFDLKEVGPNQWTASSHNFPDITASGSDPKQAVANLNRAIIYFKNNDPKAYQKQIKERLQRGWECACGEPLKPEDLVIGVWG